MAKPIFIIRFPIEVMNSQGKEQLVEITKQLQHQLTDYHVLSLYENNIDKVEFECYNSDYNDIEFKTLQEDIKSRLSEL